MIFGPKRKHVADCSCNIDETLRPVSVGQDIRLQTYRMYVLLRRVYTRRICAVFLDLRVVGYALNVVSRRNSLRFDVVTSRFQRFHYLGWAINLIARIVKKINHTLKLLLSLFFNENINTFRSRK